MARVPTLIVALALVGLVSGCAAPAGSGASGAQRTPSNAPAEATQVSEGGGVTVTATWLGPASGAIVELQLDTHSVDLDGMDMADAVLVNDRGERLGARPWTAPMGGHHRSGRLTFAGDPASFLRGASSMKLVLYDVGGVPKRTFEWAVDTDS